MHVFLFNTNRLDCGHHSVRDMHREGCVLTPPFLEHGCGRNPENARRFKYSYVSLLFSSRYKIDVPEFWNSLKYIYVYIPPPPTQHMAQHLAPSWESVSVCWLNGFVSFILSTYLCASMTSSGETRWASVRSFHVCGGPALGNNALATVPMVSWGTLLRQTLFLYHHCIYEERFFCILANNSTISSLG